MESTLSRDIKRKFKNDVFTNLIKEDIERYGKCMHSINSAYIGIEWALKQSDDIKNLELSNHQVQDILDDMGMIDENGNCPYTAEEIFKAGVEYAIEKCWRWVTENFYEDYSEDDYNFGKPYIRSVFGDGEEMLKDYNKTMKRE